LGRPVVPEVYMMRAGLSSGTSTSGGPPGVGEDVGDLGQGEPEVDRDDDRAQGVDGEHRLEELGRFVIMIATRSPALTPRRRSAAATTPIRQ
jgi:hypothetical protein